MLFNENILGVPAWSFYPIPNRHNPNLVSPFEADWIVVIAFPADSFNTTHHLTSTHRKSNELPLAPSSPDAAGSRSVPNSIRTLPLRPSPETHLNHQNHIPGFALYIRSFRFILLDQPVHALAVWMRAGFEYIHIYTYCGIEDYTSALIISITPDAPLTWGANSRRATYRRDDAALFECRCCWRTWACLRRE